MSTSVALCTYNGSQFIAEQLQSIFLQSNQPMEIIISDDASTDDTVSVVWKTWSEFRVRDPANRMVLKILENPTSLGVTFNFQQALETCSGELIALCDQDDVWHPNRLRDAELALANRAGSLLVHSNARLVDERGASLGYTLFKALEVSPVDIRAIQEGRALDVYLRRNLATGAATMIRRELLASAVPFPSEWVHDEWLAMIAAIQGGVAVITDPLIDYRQHSRNQIGVAEPTLWRKVSRVLQPRGTRNELIWERSRVLLVRLSHWSPPISHDILNRIESKVAHDLVRARLPLNRFKRVSPVLREAVTGRYSRYSSRGRADIIRDLLQPTSPQI